jgi:hypothetical protein
MPNVNMLAAMGHMRNSKSSLGSLDGELVEMAELQSMSEVQSELVSSKGSSENNAKNK